MWANVLPSVIDVSWLLIMVFITVCNRPKNKNGRTENGSLLQSYFECSLWPFFCLRKANPPYSESVQVRGASEKGEPAVFISSFLSLCGFLAGCITVQLLESSSSSPEALLEDVLNQKVARLTRTSLLVFMMSAGFTRTFSLTRGRSLQIHKWCV